MDLSFTLHAWHVLLAITALLWGAFFAWGAQPASHSGYAMFFEGLVVVLSGAALLIATLFVWLIYFAVT